MDAEQILRYDIKQCLNLIVIGKEADITEGWIKLKKLESEPAYKQLNNYESILREILNGEIFNVHEVPRIMTWFAKYLTEKPFFVNLISNDIATMLRKTVISDMSNLTMILQTLLDHSVFLPELANHSKLCEAIVVSLSTFSMPPDPKKISEFTDNATKVQKFLETVQTQSKNVESNNLIFICLQTLYRIISDTTRKQACGPGLAAILQLVDPSFIPQAVNWILSESYCDAELTQALKVLCNWLPKWRGDRLSIWIMEFIFGLEKQHKHSVLIDVTKASLDVMFRALLVPVIRQHASIVVFHILKRQGSPCLFRAIGRNMQTAITFLMKEDSESSKKCMQDLVDIMKILMLRFPGQRMCNNLDNCFPMQLNTHIVKELVTDHLWVEEMEEVEPLIESPKTQSGKVGLSNLGNTCYMNSVLQALLMTRQFCYEVLMYKPSNNTNDQVVLKKLQKLFTLLLYSNRISLAPTEILLASRPAYFLPGQQQDSSEFLCHLLDLLHEQEKTTSIPCEATDSNLKYKDDKETNDVTLINEEGGTIKRWTTEEDLTGSIALERKTQSLADFTDGEDLAQIQQLSDSHSDSTDSGIQSVGGEDTTTQVPLVHRVLGGKCKITYQCAQCDTSSHNTDKFRDLQLCFPEEIQENQEVSVQDLINYYLTPEKLTGENKYRCDKCMKLCDAQRIIKILHTPTYLILILKHFRYDFDTRLRTKLRHKVMYNETIQLPVSSSLCTTNETYQLYAAVVHSGYSVDYGHYFTYARDSKQNWYKFNDSYVSQTTFNDFRDLKPPDTPYILFYEKSVPFDGIYEEDKPELSTLSKQLQELVANDTTAYIEELRHQAQKSQRGQQNSILLRRNENSDDENPPPSSCRGAVNVPTSRFLY
ncbi:PREDICTED: ubiquitin carboxyl-terminal hydrolase 35 [Dufourea novaeangliae]|uniref:Ubiquitin carboxyl-terminal hydrolase 38 n=1 Tax=Dufourea novaeangliae TaxID=178035 RepID=A0A154PAN5_DUFNO|nr:PREDICTED: ubiquitin carboxyl-terminal hydrolase 35 [Dufourea novaeangliae]KZC08288.1 Ubiquitin carboxyl-terminal hydrolase 38 [Dufourea novaeangliae]